MTDAVVAGDEISGAGSISGEESAGEETAGRENAGEEGAGQEAVPNDRYDERDHTRFALVPAAYVLLRREAPPAPWNGGTGRRGLPPGPGAPGSTEVLLQLRQNTGYRDGFWACAAAGHVEEGESVVEAAVREAAEELGVTVDPADLRPLTVLHRGEPGGPAVEQRVDFFFETTRWEGTPRILEPEKTADLAWVPLAEPPVSLVPHEAVVLDAVRAREISGRDVPRLITFGFDDAAGRAG
ncbi:NUDIX domain-containing protein [Myceligenerans sp. TRM 65318]|uniref:NUDIX domain-containing protein n=2 Tax=Myceligenerans pegani TaxID=2776917 RepID=A0ABR9MYJ7_9MICO|nr:NUDIX domain-containing protein [Myceligenerans sp. TRM 65318]MBE3018735.1 NUDIX domain-containing protein [Myceligenerans sp. TRM 65318]